MSRPQRVQRLQGLLCLQRLLRVQHKSFVTSIVPKLEMLEYKLAFVGLVAAAMLPTRPIFLVTDNLSHSTSNQLSLSYRCE